MFVIWLAFRVAYLVTEGDWYPNPHGPDHLVRNPLYIWLSHKIKRLEWFTDKVRMEAVIPRVWGIP